MTERQYEHDVLIIGSGAAGLALALQLAPHARLAVLCKEGLGESATRYAQGGISAVMDVGDSIDSHIADTLAVGAGLCRPEVVRHVVERGPATVRWLVERGVEFTHETGSGGFHLYREGGHSHRRIVHAADSTGRAIASTLEEQACAHRSIDLFQRHIAVDLIARRTGDGRCLGAYVYDEARDRVRVFRARYTVLATGGIGKIYLYTSNPDVCTGDGIAMAWRIGCRIANMEFIQFHPTCLYHPHAKSFLITEALRGEGARLLLPDGTRFMPRFHANAELAPRDVVARAIDHEMKRLGIDHVCLDIGHLDAGFVRERFPTVYRRCRELGLDPSSRPIPVVPAAHYACGGVMTDLRGRTDVPGLYAVGETGCTGLHGANRIASNSLLECLVLAHAAYGDIRAGLADVAPLPTLPEWDESRVTDSDEEVVVKHNWQELRRCMWDYVGIVRTDKRLARAQRRLDLLQAEIADYYGHFRLNRDLIELRNLIVTADLVTRSAAARRESRGLHYTTDNPDPLPEARDTVLRRNSPISSIGA